MPMRMTKVEFLQLIDHKDKRFFHLLFSFPEMSDQ